MILWTLISIALIVLVVRETRKNAATNIWASFTNPGWGYVATLWFIGSLTLWLLTP